MNVAALSPPAVVPFDDDHFLGGNHFSALWPKSAKTIQRALTLGGGGKEDFKGEN